MDHNESSVIIVNRWKLILDDDRNSIRAFKWISTSDFRMVVSGGLGTKITKNRSVSKVPHIRRPAGPNFKERMDPTQATQHPGVPKVPMADDSLQGNVLRKRRHPYSSTQPDSSKDTAVSQALARHSKGSLISSARWAILPVERDGWQQMTTDNMDILIVARWWIN